MKMIYDKDIDLILSDDDIKSLKQTERDLKEEKQSIYTRMSSSRYEKV